MLTTWFLWDDADDDGIKDIVVLKSYPRQSPNAIGEGEINTWIGTYQLKQALPGNPHTDAAIKYAISYTTMMNIKIYVIKKVTYKE